MMFMFGLAAAEDIPRSPVVMLKGNPTTGYAWQAVVEAAEVLSVSVEYSAENTGLIGSGGQYEVRFMGLMPGEATITMTYARPWENQTPLYTLVYRVCVDEELNVTILSSSFDW